MAIKKNYISNKDRKKQEAEEQKKGYVPIQRRMWGKIVIIVLCLAMIIVPFVMLIWYLATEV